MQAGAAPPVPSAEPATAFAARAKAAWARLIRNVYEADPLECPKCKGPMRVIALIEDPGIIHRILDHLTSPDLPFERNASGQPGCRKELAALWRLE